MHRRNRLSLLVLLALAAAAAVFAARRHAAAGLRGKAVGAAPAAPPKTLEALERAFRAAYDARDVDALLRLVYFEGVDSSTRASFRREIAVVVGAEPHADSIVMRDPSAGDVSRFTMRGVAYEPSLPVVKVLEIHFHDAHGMTSDGFKVGTRDGAYYLVTVAPAAHPAAAPAYTHTYTVPRYGIVLRYPDGYEVVDGIDGRLFTHTDLTFNRAEPVGTLVYTDPRFAGTSYAGAGIAIWKVDPPDPPGCRTLGSPDTSGGGGLAFYQAAGAATDGTISKKDSFYLVSHGGDCFRLDARVAVQTASGKAPMAAQDGVDLLEAMNAVSRTLRFAR